MCNTIIKVFLKVVKSYKNFLNFYLIHSKSLKKIDVDLSACCYEKALITAFKTKVKSFRQKNRGKMSDDKSHRLHFFQISFSVNSTTFSKLTVRFWS